MMRRRAVQQHLGVARDEGGEHVTVVGVQLAAVAVG
jgi:hypothetical protein